MKPKRCISLNCVHREQCEYGKRDILAREYFPDEGERCKHTCPTIRPVASVCNRWKVAATIIALMLSMSVNAQTIDQVKAELQRQGLPHPEIVLAQARLETGNFTSQQCRVKHNLFGIKHNGRYASYRTWQDSVADYKARISSRYTGGDYYAFLRRIGYAEDPAYISKLKRF